jgi:predicted PurR-regulated permease PerM
MRPLYAVAAVVVTLWGLHVAAEFFIPVLLAALLAFLMAPVTHLLRRLHAPEWLAVIAAVLVILIPLGGFIYLVVNEVEALIHGWPQLRASFSHTLTALRESGLAGALHLRAVLNVPALEARLHANVGSEFVLALKSLKAILSTGTTIALTIFFGITMLASRRHLERAANAVMTSYSTIEPGETVGTMARLIEAFLVARTAIAVGLGVVSFVILLVFGIPYSFLLGAFLGAMTWVPIVGFFVGIAPVIVVGVGAGESVTWLLLCGLALGAVWLAQDHIITPKVVGRRLQLNFLATYLAFFAGGLLWGPWGMILSIPLLGVIRVACAASPTLQPWAFAIGDDRPSSPSRSQ